LLSKAKVTDGILPDLTEQQLEKLGLALGEIVAFRKEAAALAAPPSTSAAAGGGVAAAATALSSMSLSPAPAPAPAPAAASLDAPRSLASSNFKREHAHAASSFHQDLVPDDMTDQ
jgi:hypothetical protein